jgi:hypothetical protein
MRSISFSIYSNSNAFSKVAQSGSQRAEFRVSGFKLNPAKIITAAHYTPSTSLIKANLEGKSG